MRLGLIVPSSNTVMEVDFYRNVSREITLHTARMHLKETTVAGEEAMLDRFLPQAITDIASLNPDVAVFGCTSAGALRGNAYDDVIISRMSEECRAPAVSVIGSARRALRGLGVQTVGVITPYIDQLNQRIKKSLEDDGVRVEFIAGMGIDDNFRIAAVPADEIVRFGVEKASGRKIDCLFISCTNFRGMDARPELQERLGLPVVTSNQVALERAIRLLEDIV